MSAALAFAFAALTSTQPEHREYFVYVACESSDEVYLTGFDGENVHVLERVSVGVLPTETEGAHGLTVDPAGDHWFVSMAHGKPYGTLYKYTTGANELVGQVELGLFPATMQISSATELLYCVNFDLHGDMTPSSISIVDPEEMVEVERTTTGSMPHGSRLSPDGTRHFSCAMMSDDLFELDAMTFEVARTLRLTDGMGGVPPRRDDDHHEAVAKPTWVEPHPEKPLVYVALNGVAQVVEINLESWKITRRFPTARGPYNLAVTRDGKQLVVTYKGAQSIGVWDLVAGTELGRVPTSRRVTHGVVLSPDDRYAFVSSEGVGAERGTLDVIELETRTRVATAELGLQAGGIAFWKTEGVATR